MTSKKDCGGCNHHNPSLMWLASALAGRGPGTGVADVRGGAVVTLANPLTLIRRGAGVKIWGVQGHLRKGLPGEYGVHSIARGSLLVRHMDGWMAGCRRFRQCCATADARRARRVQAGGT